MLERANASSDSKLPPTPIAMLSLWGARAEAPPVVGESVRGRRKLSDGDRLSGSEGECGAVCGGEDGAVRGGDGGADSAVPDDAPAALSACCCRLSTGAGRSELGDVAATVGPPGRAKRAAYLRHVSLSVAMLDTTHNFVTHKKKKKKKKNTKQNNNFNFCQCDSVKAWRRWPVPCKL